MIARAYEYAEGVGVIPQELRLARFIDKFGAQAVFGRVIGYGEANRIMTAESIIRAHKSLEQSENWAAWAVKYPEEARLLSFAAELTNG